MDGVMGGWSVRMFCDKFCANLAVIFYDNVAIVSAIIFAIVPIHGHVHMYFHLSQSFCYSFCS